MARAKKNVVVVESPAKAKTIEKILGTNFVVLASYGHVRDLPKSKLSIDIENDFEPTYELVDKKKDALDKIRKALEGGGDLFLCPDPDREGEAIAFHLSEVLDVHPDKTHRVTFNEITPKAIHEAFSHPRKLDMDLVNSQQARRILDRIVGYKLSPLLWKKVLRGLSAGRVQSVAVRLVSEREKEILEFKPKEYWTIDGEFSAKGGTFKAELKSLDGTKLAASAEDVEKAAEGSVRVVAGEEASALKAAFASKKGEVKAYDSKETKEHAYPPFSTSLLQQAAVNVLGFDTKRTMRTAQDLYEGVKMGAGQVGLITYMRTDSFNVSKDAVEATRDFVKATFGSEFYPDKPNYYKSKKGSQEAHECVRPTNVALTPDEARPYLQPDQQKLYELIWKRFVSSQMAPATYDSTSCEVEVKASVGVGLFRANGRVMKFKGWRAVAGFEGDKKLPAMVVGDSSTVSAVAAEQHFTQPPPRFNEASLVKLLESEGIGRPSTYSSILEVIQARGYVVKTSVGGRAPLKATELGMMVTDRLVGHFPSIMDVGFTRDMEETLDLVEDGEKDYKRVLKDFYKSFNSELKAADKAMPAKVGAPSDEKCRKCGGAMVKLLGRFGSFLKCEKDDCKATLNLAADGTVEEKAPPKPTGIKCDKCGKDVVLAKGRFGEYLCCEDYKDKKCDFTMKITKARQPARKVPPAATDVKCEKCGKNMMVIRVAARGKAKVGKPFLSCLGFPRCRAAEDVPEALSVAAAQQVEKWKVLRAKDIADSAKLKNFFEEND